MNRRLLTIMTVLLCSVMTFAQNINFADSKVKEICVANWDTNGDRVLIQTMTKRLPTTYKAFRHKRKALG